ncbi:MAG TPA: hypothetical protein VK673_14075, partial [Chthoniobacterales bacterium]|nr:hypothetical protein [Chthoniobacterales bacterium]
MAVVLVLVLDLGGASGSTDGTYGTPGTCGRQTANRERRTGNGEPSLRLWDFLAKLATNDAPGAVLAPNLLLAAQSGGILYAFTEATLEGKLVLAVLFIASIFSWSV